MTFDFSFKLISFDILEFKAYDFIKDEFLSKYRRHKNSKVKKSV